MSEKVKEILEYCSESHSIDFKICKNDYYKIITNTEFERMMNEQSSNRSTIANVVLPNFHVENEEKDEYFIFKRTKLRNMKNAVSIAQNEIEKEIFGNEIIIIHKEPISVRAEVTIRSDDFTDGALNQRFEVKI